MHSTNKKTNLLVIIFGLFNLILVGFFEFSCPWKTNFDIDCAGCGLTRMFKSLLKFDIYQAFRYNPLMFILLIILIIYIIYILISILLKKEYYHIKDRDLWILLVLILIFTILRNIPGLEVLKPTDVR